MIVFREGVSHRGRARPEARETELLARARHGDVAAFEELARANVDRVFPVALRLVGDPGEAEDVVQETLLRAWRGIGGFRGRSTFLTWLHRIAVNEASRALAKSTRRPPTVHLTAEQLQLSSASDDGPAHQVEYHELRTALQLALLALPLPYRTAVVLRDIEGFSTREAAAVAGIGEAAFKSRLHDARLKIRTALGDAALIAAAR
jgi:RNA polymerase sigma-70 factor (ECF subfamily)